MDKYLDKILEECSEGDVLICTSPNFRFSVGQSYSVKDSAGFLHVVDDKGYPSTFSGAKFQKVQPSQTPQLAPREEATESDANPRSIVDGDYSQYCTWDVEEPETETSEWKPDTIREDIDIMESIRHACNRT